MNGRMAARDLRDSSLGRLLPFVAGALFFVNNFPGVEALLFLVLVFNLAVGRGGVRIPRSPIVPLMVVLLVVSGLIGAVMSDGLELLVLASFLSKFFVFFTIVFTDYSKEQFRCLIHGFVGGAAVSSTLMALNFFGFIDISPPLDYIEIRQSAFMGDPNIVAAFLVVALMLAFHHLKGEGSGSAAGAVHPGVRWALVSVILFGLLLTFSRAAWINLVVAVSVYAFFMPFVQPERRRALLPAGLFLLSAVAVVVVLRSTTELLDVFFDRFDPDLLSEATHQRRSTQVEVLGAFHGSDLASLLFGHGPLSSEKVTGMNPHFTPYQVFFELGLVASTIAILIAAMTLFRAVKHVSSAPAVLSVLPPCLIGFAVNSLAVDTFYWRLPWFLVAVVVVCASAAPAGTVIVRRGDLSPERSPVVARS